MQFKTRKDCLDCGIGRRRMEEWECEGERGG